MFFPRLRNQAKWAFVFLIFVFGGGFVFLGVGSGGLDIGQLVRDAFGNQGGSGTSVSEPPRKRFSSARSARSRGASSRTPSRSTAASTRRSPPGPSTCACGRRTSQPSGISASSSSGRQTASSATRSSPRSPSRRPAIGSAFVPSQSGKLGQAIGQNPIEQALSTKAGGQLQQASIKYQTAATRAVGTYKALVRLQPTDQQALFSLAQAADTLRQTTVAIDAYKRLLKFKLDPTTAAQIRERIKTLQQTAQAAGG